MTTPLLPDTAGVATFGGNDHFNEDVVVNPNAEQSATDWDRMVTQTAMAAFTQCRAWVRCTVSAGVVTLASHGATWGNANAVAPTVVRTSAGFYKVTWAAAYNDLQATPESHGVNVRAITGSSAERGATPIFHNEVIISPVEVWIYTADQSGAAIDCTSFSFSWA